MAISIPGNSAGDRGVGQSTGTLDIQDAVTVQLPGNVGAAGAGSNDFRLALYILDSVADSKVLSIAVVAHVENHSVAAAEGRARYVGDTVRQVNICKRRAIAESISVNGLHAFRQGDLHQGGASAQGRAADSGQPAALCKVYYFQSRASEKGKVRKVGNAGFDIHHTDHIVISVPSNPGSRLGAVEGTGTLDFQDAIRVQLPGSIGTAGAGGNDLGGTLHVIDSVANGILLRITVVGYAENHTAAALECRGGNKTDVIGKIDTVERRAAGKGPSVDGLQAFRQNNGCQRTAVIEGGAANQGELCALLQVDADQAGAAVKGRPGNGG